MKMLLALAAALAGSSGVGAAPAPVHPTYAGSPNRRIAFGDIVGITNFSALDSGRDLPGAPRAGVQLARAGGAAQPQGTGGQGSNGQASGHRPAIYGHNVSGRYVGYGATSAHRTAIYGITIEDYAACRAGRGRHPGVAARPCEKVTTTPNGVGWRARRSGDRMTIYYIHIGQGGHDVYIGPHGKPSGQRAIIYNGTITSEPTNTLACGATTGVHTGAGISIRGARGAGGCAATHFVPTGAVRAASPRSAPTASPSP